MRAVLALSAAAVLLMVAAFAAVPTAQAAPASVTPKSMNSTCQEEAIAAGALIGGLSGAALANAISNYACNQVTPSGDTSLQATEARLSAMSNLLNQSMEYTANDLGTLNKTTNAFEYAASAAALAQLSKSNASFSATQDLQDSGIAHQLAGVEFSDTYPVYDAIYMFYQWWSAQMGTNGIYSSSPTNVSVTSYTPTATVGSFPLDPTFGDQIFAGAGPVSSPAYLGGSIQTSNGSFGGTILNQVGETTTLNGAKICQTDYQDYTNTSTGQVTKSTVTAIQVPGGNYCYDLSSFPGGGSYYNISTSGGNGVTGADYVCCESGTNSVYVGDSANYGQALKIGIPKEYQYPLLPGVSDSVPKGSGAFINLPSYLSTIATTSTNVALAYVMFLHSLNIWNANQIPASCLILSPSQLLPPSQNLGNLSPAQIQALYYAELQALSGDYNQSLGTSTFCHHTVPPPIGAGPGFNTTINASGQVYVPLSAGGNTTELINAPQTWQYSGEMILMPKVLSATIPVGTSWQPAANNPFQIYVYQPSAIWGGTWLGNVVGNASAGGSTTLNTQWYGIHLTYCSINGTPTVQCTIPLENLNNTPGNQQCGQGQLCVPYPPSNGGFGGINLGCLNPFLWGTCISNWANGLFGAFWGPIVEVIAIIIIVVVLIAVLIVASKFLGVSRNGGGMR